MRKYLTDCTVQQLMDELLQMPPNTKVNVPIYPPGDSMISDVVVDLRDVRGQPKVDIEGFNRDNECIQYELVKQKGV
jgi:hypothetical protein